MIKLFIHFTLVVLSCFVSLAKTPEEDLMFSEDYLDIIIQDNRIFNQSNLGFSLNFSKIVAEVYEVGFYMGAHWKKFNPTNFDLINPQVVNADVGLVFKNAFFKEKNYNLKSFINLVWSFSSLNDRDRIVEVGIDDLEFENFGGNSFFSLTPGLEYQLRLNQAESILPMYLTFRAGYRLPIGNTEFGRIRDYSGLFYGIGITFVTNLFDWD